MAAALLLTSFVLWRERSLRFERRDLLTLLAAGAAGTIVNQFAFAYAIKLSGVTTTALLIGTIPAVTALVAAALGVERLRRRAVVAGAVSFAGVGLVVAGSGGSLTASVLGELCGLAVALSWALYTVLLKPLSERYSPFRIYAVVLCEGALLMAIGGAGQLHAQRWEISGVAWLIMAAGTIGPLVLANVLWVICVGKVGPSRATLFSNLQPVFATVFAVLLVAESVGWIQVAGGALIGVAIAIGRRTARGMDSTRKGVAKRALRGMARGRASR